MVLVQLTTLCRTASFSAFELGRIPSGGKVVSMRAHIHKVKAYLHKNEGSLPVKLNYVVKKGGV